MIAFLVCWMVFKLKIGPCHLGRHSGAAASSSNLFKVKPWKKGEWLWNRISTTLRWSKTYAQEIGKISLLSKGCKNTQNRRKYYASDTRREIKLSEWYFFQTFWQPRWGFWCVPFWRKTNGFIFLHFFATQFSNPLKLALRTTTYNVCSLKKCLMF